MVGAFLKEPRPNVTQNYLAVSQYRADSRVTNCLNPIHIFTSFSVMIHLITILSFPTKFLKHYLPSHSLNIVLYLG
jgi:hypothetical protein